MDEASARLAPWFSLPAFAAKREGGRGRLPGGRPAWAWRVLRRVGAAPWLAFLCSSPPRSVGPFHRSFLAGGGSCQGGLSVSLACLPEW
jgi:hypothetical protein